MLNGQCYFFWRKFTKTIHFCEYLRPFKHVDKKYVNHAKGAPPTQSEQTARLRPDCAATAHTDPRGAIAGNIPQLYTHTACQPRYCMSFDVRKLVIMTKTLPDKIQTDMLSRSFVVQFDAATPAADRHLPNHSLTHSSAILDVATGKTGGRRGQYPPPGELTRAIPA